MRSVCCVMLKVCTVGCCSCLGCRCNREDVSSSTVRAGATLPRLYSSPDDMPGPHPLPIAVYAFKFERNQNRNFRLPRLKPPFGNALPSTRASASLHSPLPSPCPTRKSPSGYANPVSPASPLASPPPPSPPRPSSASPRQTSTRSASTPPPTGSACSISSTTTAARTPRRPRNAPAQPAEGSPCGDSRAPTPTPSPRPSRAQPPPRHRPRT